MPTPFRVSDYAAGKLPIVCIAHRGFSSKYPENTLLAFEKAVEVGADMIEFDIRWTADGHLVIFHDQDLRRIAGRPDRIEDLSLEQVRQVDMGMDQKIPTFEEVMDRMAGRIGMNLHVQSPDELVDRVIDACRKAGILEEVFLAVGWEDEIRRLRAEQPDVWVCSLVGQWEPSYVKANFPLDVKLLQPSHRIFERTGDEEVRLAKQAGMVMGVFYADLYSDFLWMKRLGVEGILTNCPDVFREVLG